MSKPTNQDLAVSNAQLVPDRAKDELKRFWTANSKQIAAVTAGGDVERVMRVTYSLLYRTPKLVSCTPFSLLNGIVLAHQMGLVFGTPEVSLIPFGTEATLVIGYQGRVKLALGSKLITSIEADNVLDCDEFEYEVTQDGLHFRHKPQWKGRPMASDENLIGSYCQLKTAGGGVQTRFVPLEEVLRARARSRGFKSAQGRSTDTPWISAFDAMARKTSIHRACKMAPQDMRMSVASAVDDEEEGGAGVIAEGLNPADFGHKDLQDPLVPTGRDAAQEVAAEKIKANAKFPGVKEFATLPDAVPLVTGALAKQGGRVWEVVDGQDGHTWKLAEGE